MDSISTIFTKYYTAEKVGELRLGDANLKHLLATIYTEIRIMDHSVKSGSDTPQVAFHRAIMNGLEKLGYFKILQGTAELTNYITNPKFGGSTVGAPLGSMIKRTKETFDIRFDVSYAEQEMTLDECKFFLLVKAHRLFLAELSKKASRSYNPADIEPGKAVYRKYAGDAQQVRNGKTVMVPIFTEHSSVDFVDYVTLLKDIYTPMYAYSDNLSEFTKIFGEAAAASKELSTKMAQNKQRSKTLAEQRGSPKIEKKTPPQKKVVVNDTTVKAAPPPVVNAWSQRKADFEAALSLLGMEGIQEEESDTEVPAAEPEPVAEPVEEFVSVSRKKTEKKPEKKPMAKGASRGKQLANLS